VWVGGLYNGVPLTGSYDIDGNRILSKPFGNSTANKYTGVCCDNGNFSEVEVPGECNGTFYYKDVDCSIGLEYDNGELYYDPTSRCETDMDEAGWKREINKSLQWWRECFKTATNVDVHFRVLGEEIPADGYLPEVSSATLSGEDMAKYNIGDIRVCAYDFWKSGCNLSNVLMYAYKHQPCDYNEHGNPNYNTYTCPNDNNSENGYLGNIYINTSICWRKDNNTDILFDGTTDGKCGHDHFSLLLTFAHELGHSIGLAHDCNSGTGSSYGFYPCVGGERGIMAPSIDQWGTLPTACGSWVDYYLKDIYCGDSCPCSTLASHKFDPGATKRRRKKWTSEEKQTALTLKLTETISTPEIWTITKTGKCELITL